MCDWSSTIIVCIREWICAPKVDNSQTATTVNLCNCCSSSSKQTVSIDDIHLAEKIPINSGEHHDKDCPESDKKPDADKNKNLCKYCPEGDQFDLGASRNPNLHLVSCLRRRYPQHLYPNFSTCPKCDYWMPNEAKEGREIFKKHVKNCRKTKVVTQQVKKSSEGTKAEEVLEVLED